MGTRIKFSVPEGVQDVLFMVLAMIIWVVLGLFFWLFPGKEPTPADFYPLD